MKNNIIPIVYYRTNFMNTYFLLTKKHNYSQPKIY